MSFCELNESINFEELKAETLDPLRRFEELTIMNPKRSVANLSTKERILNLKLQKVTADPYVIASNETRNIKFLEG